MRELYLSPKRASGRCRFQSHQYRSSSFRKVLAPAHCRLEPMQSPPVLLLDFKLLRKSGSVLPRSRESLDPRMTADSRLRISGSALMLSESDKDNGALDRHRLDWKRCSPLPFGAPRDNADADAKATFAESQSELQVSAPLLLDLAASCRRQQRTAAALRAILFCLQPQIRFPNVARHASRCSTPRPDHKQPNR